MSDARKTVSSEHDRHTPTALLNDDGELLVERERRSAGRLRVLADASRVFSMTHPDVGSVLNAVATQVVTNIGSSCVIALASPDGEWLDAAAIRDLDPATER